MKKITFNKKNFARGVTILSGLFALDVFAVMNSMCHTCMRELSVVSTGLLLITLIIVLPLSVDFESEVKT